MKKNKMGSDIFKDDSFSMVFSNEFDDENDLDEHVDNLPKERSKARLTGSILEEITGHRPVSNVDHLLETKASNCIHSACNIIQYIKDNYNDEEADLLVAKFISSIRSQEPSKFTKMVRKLKDVKK